MPKSKKKASPKAPDSIRLPDDLKDKLIKQAGKENRSLSNLIITILKQWIEKLK